MPRANNKVVLITGTTSGLGKALQELYLSSGCSVIAINRRDTLGQPNPNLHLFNCDITTSESVNLLIKRLINQNLIPDVWILNAGVTEVDHQKVLDTKVFRRVVETNLYGNLNFIEALQSLGLEGRTIVSISSTSIIVPNSNSLGYYASKLSLYGLFKMFRLCDGKNNYKIVLLGPTHTNLNKSLPMHQGLQKSVYSFLTLEPQFVARRIQKFAKNSNFLLYPSLRTRVFYFLLSSILKFFPSAYYKKHKDPV